MADVWTMILTRPLACLQATSASSRFSGSDRNGNSPVPPLTAMICTPFSISESMLFLYALVSMDAPLSLNGVQIGTQTPSSLLMVPLRDGGTRWRLGLGL